MTDDASRDDTSVSDHVTTVHCTAPGSKPLTGHAFASGSDAGTISLVDTEGLFTRSRRTARLHTRKLYAIGFRLALRKLMISGAFGRLSVSERSGPRKTGSSGGSRWFEAKAAKHE